MLHGDPIGLVISLADQHDALMVVTGTRGEGVAAGLGRLARPSVSHGLIARAHRPVLVVSADLTEDEMKVRDVTSMSVATLQPGTPAQVAAATARPGDDLVDLGALAIHDRG
jgi:CO dehydrogenase/acetyl-CoA synthase epsilon subunit